MENDYEDEDDSGQREELENKLFAMREMLKQLNEAHDGQDPPRNNPQYFQGGRGPHGTVGGGRGKNSYQGRGRGGYQDGRGRGMGRPQEYIPPFQVEQHGEYGEGYQGPYRGEEGYEGPYRGHEGYLGPYRGEEGYGGPYRGHEGYRGPYRGEEGPYRGHEGYQGYRGRGEGYGSLYRGHEGYRGYRGRGEGYGSPYRGRGDGYRGRGEGYGGSYRGRGDGYRGRGDGYRGRGDGYRGREHSPSPHLFDYGNDLCNTDDQQNLRHPKQMFAIRPQFLAETLADCPDLSCSLLQLLEKRNMKPDFVRDVAINYPYVFNIKDEAIELRPQIKICPDHCSPQGCQNPSSCKDLHICDKYVLTFCNDRSCVLGHKWRTGHNDPVLKPLLIDRLPFPTLRRLLQRAEDHNAGSSDLLDVCTEYNEEGCNRRSCASLHLCINFVTGLTRCKVSDCQLNHDVLSPSCRQLLDKHGIPTNEAPRDVIVVLITRNPSLNNEGKQKSPQKKDLKEPPKQAKEKEKPVRHKPEEENVKSGAKKSQNKEIKNTPKKNSKIDDSETSSDTESGSSSDTDDGGQVEEKKVKKSEITVKPPEVKTPKVIKPAKENPNPVQPTPRRTLWSHYLQGDVLIPEICYYSVESSCKSEGSGCQRLHATKHFHWQVCEQGTRWLNLRPEQVVSLEYAYCDPDKPSADLPKLDPATLEYSVSGLFILMGRENWQSDFRKMVLSNTSKSKVLKIRRLCTETVDGQKIKPASYMWYFLDNNSTWVQYGNVDTTGASHHVSNITSSDIEKQFLQDPTSSLPFKSLKFTYILDFKASTQMNLSTRVTRQVIRRPVPHLQEKKNEEDKQKASIGLPDLWQKMQPEERMCLVSMSSSSTEYKAVIGLLRGPQSLGVIGLLRGTHSLGGRVIKIQRVQNPYLWRAFQNKVKEMMAVYKDASKVNVRQLFHGTTDTIVHNICAENFDWRLHGSKSGQMFGRGSYFAVDSDYSYNYAQPDSKGLRYMFIARVAVGVTTRGNSTMVRPPSNPATSVLFDSTVDSVSNPRIIVKYDKQEYYPEYLLTID